MTTPTKQILQFLSFNVALLCVGSILIACSPKDTNKPELIGPEPLSLEEIIAEPYDADTATYDETTGERLD